MKDFNGEIQYKGKSYKLVFNLNVMETIQEEYGSIDVWGELTDGSEYAKREYEKAIQSKKNATPWNELSDAEKAKWSGEPDAKAIIFGFTEMINEGIDIENDEKRAQGDAQSLRPFITIKQGGRLITEIGLEKATEKIHETVIESQHLDGEESKNE